MPRLPATAMIIPLLPLFALAAPEWVADPFEPPPHAVAAGAEAGLVCHSEFMGGLHAGSYLDGLCHIDYGGFDQAQTSFEVLVEEDAEAVRWVGAADGEIPPGALPTGAEPWPSDAPDLIQYSCRSDIWVPDSASGKPVWKHLGVRLGKLIGAFCNVPVGERVVSAAKYEVLVIEGGTAGTRTGRQRRVGAGTSGWFSPDGRRMPRDARGFRLGR